MDTEGLVETAELWRREYKKTKAELDELLGRHAALLEEHQRTTGLVEELRRRVEAQETQIENMRRGVRVKDIALQTQLEDSKALIDELLQSGAQANPSEGSPRLEPHVSKAEETEPIAGPSKLTRVHQRRFKTDANAEEPPADFDAKAEDNDAKTGEDVPPRITPPATPVPSPTRRRLIRTIESQSGSDAIPEARLRILRDLPKITDDLPDGGLGKAFGRDHIASVLGGNYQAAINKTTYTFRLVSNPWLSQRRLDHGYAFVGLPGGGNDREIGVDGATIRPLFVGFEPKIKGKGAKDWYYMGTYAFQLSGATPEESSLSLEEWNGLTQKTRTDYFSFAALRFKKTPLETDMLFSTGSERCPLRLAQCIGFDKDLYQGLLDGVPYDKPTTSPSKKRAMDSATSATTGKRRRTHKAKAKSEDEYKPESDGESELTELPEEEYKVDDDMDIDGGAAQVQFDEIPYFKEEPDVDSKWIY